MDRLNKLDVWCICRQPSGWLGAPFGRSINEKKRSESAYDRKPGEAGNCRNYRHGSLDVSSGGARWVLSPAYDLTYSNSIGGEHATTVNGNGADPGMDDILAVAKR